MLGLSPGEDGLNGLALCAGYAGLELALERVFPRYRTVCYVEGEAFAVQHLVKKMEEGRLDFAPIWSNVRTFDGKPWRGKVDFITGGFPCQPYSTAGKQMGEADSRDLWADFVRITGEVRPGFLFLENVPNVVKMRLDSIVLDLDKLGYHASWCVVAASDFGAPHQRKRWFLLAVSHASSIGRDQNERNIWCGKLDVERSSEIISNTNGSRPVQSGKMGSIEQNSKQQNADFFGSCRFSDKWEGRFHSMWETEPGLGRLVDGASDWMDKLRILGNGVVPQQAYSALQILGGRLACGIVANLEPKG